MGLNSTEVSYGFGQMGSAITDSATPLYPPKNMVIVAKTALVDTTFHANTGLIAELQDRNIADAAYRFVNTEDNSHADGDFSVGSCHNSGSTSFTTTIGAATAEINVGQTVESATLFPRNITNPIKVTSYTKGATTMTTNIKGAALASGAAESVFFFNDLSQGYGGLEMDASDKLPKGLTIYGRWTGVKLSGAGDANSNRIICYFGH